MTSITLAEVAARLRPRAPGRIAEPFAEAAVALILTPSAHDLEALFIRRAQYAGDPWSGHMALPGGRRQGDDSGLLETAMRETMEETGVRLAAADLLGELDEFTPRTPVLPQIKIRPFVFGLKTRPDVVVSREVAYHRWLSLAQLRESATVTEVEVRGARISVPAHVVGPDVIWGLTERILKPFLELSA